MRDFPYPEDIFQPDIAADAYERNPGELPSKEKKPPSGGCCNRFSRKFLQFYRRIITPTA
jgi:hypothetical protein